MKTLLLLSSGSFLDQDLTPYIGKPLKDLKIAHIISASKGKGVDDLSYIDRTKERFKKNNCYFEDIDLDGKNEDELRKILKNFNAVFVNGGSTFYLLKSIRESGFDKVIKELLPQGFIYMGASAGSYVACPTIEMALWAHQDKYDHCGLTDLTGMNLIPFLLSVHYIPEFHDLLKEKSSQSNYKTRILTDNQAILVRDDKIELIGQEPEIIL
jgi:dipeptidase E